LFFLSENLMDDLWCKIIVAIILGVISGCTIGHIVNKELNK
jgi:Na+/H+-dicarboxylate symporter